MFCSITGETPDEPVISVKSGHVFEKRVIEKYLRDNDGKDPISKEPLSPEDLIPVKSNKPVKPRPPTATSIPGLLHLFQNEWDSLMLETYSLKQQLDGVRQELAHALYQHDAACRVIARLIKERDEAKATLANLHTQVGSVPQNQQASSEMEVEQTTGFTDNIKAKITSKSQELSKSRKKRTAPSTLATIEDISKYTTISSHPVHASSPPGILCVDIHPTHQDMVVTGGADHHVNVFNRSSSKVTAKLTGHSKKINEVQIHPTEDLIFSASVDKTARVWRKSGSGYEAANVVKTHTAEVTACTLQATGDYWATASLDSTWAFHDIETSNVLSQTNADAPIHSAQFHPDGLILGAGADNLVKIYDLKSLKNVANFEGHTGKVLDVTFSENGYYLATASEDATVKLWDLRKLKNFHTFDLPKEFKVSSIEWDYSGTYLAVCGSDIRVYVAKTLNHVATLKEHTAQVTDAKWGKDAQFLVSTSMDRSLKFIGKK